MGRSRDSGPRHPRGYRRQPFPVMTGPAASSPPRPRRTDVAAIYDRWADVYDLLWSPVILPPAAALVPLLGLGHRSMVVDVGAGTGALVDAIRSAAPTARVVALDASAEMLRLARARRGASAVRADALALPIADGTADVVVLAYVLFHLADPSSALTEAARVLLPGGRAGTVTWASEQGPRAEAVWEEILGDAAVPPSPPRRADTGLDRPEAMEALLRSAGLRPERIWLQRLRHQWDRASFWQLATGSGVNRTRLALADPATRAVVLTRAQNALGRLSAGDYQWEGEVLCTVATKANLGQRKAAPAWRHPAQDPQTARSLGSAG
jgi:SAM-dependent methyltransferase